MSSNKIQTIIVFNVKVQIQSIFISMIPQYIPRKLYIAENCISLGRMDNVTRYKITESSQSSSQAYYHLSFELSEQQSYASEHIV